MRRRGGPWSSIPRLPRAYAVLGILQMLDGEIDRAIESVQQAVELDPNGADARLNLAIVLHLRGAEPGGAGGHGTGAATRPEAEGAGLRLLRPGAVHEPPLRRGAQGPRARSGRKAGRCRPRDPGHGERPTGPHGGRARGGGGHSQEDSQPERCQSPRHVRASSAAGRIWTTGWTRSSRRECRSGVTVSVAGRRIGWTRRRSAPSPRARRGPGICRTARLSSCSWARTAISRCVRKRAWSWAGSRSKRTSSARNPRRALLGRKFCSPVYRNPGGSGETRNEYVYPDSTTVRYFSVAQ